MDIKLVVLFVSAVLVNISTVFAGDIYVRQNESNGNGTIDQPYATLWQAINKACRGDVIHIAGGVYEGKGGSGSFVIKIPNLTLAGGYDQKFTKREPFKNLTVLQRSLNYKGDETGMAIIQGDERSDHQGLVIDGLVLNGETRNRYTETKIIPKKSSKGCLVKWNSPNVAVRNCILANSYGEGINAAWKGKNEVVNCYIVNTFHEAISTRAAQDQAVVLIKNNTIAFCWEQPSMGGGIGVLVGRCGKIIVRNNLFAYIITESNGGIGVDNPYGNDLTELTDNLFYQCQNGFYKCMDADRMNLMISDASGLKGLDEDPETWMLEKADQNRSIDPGIRPDKAYFQKFSGFVGSNPGKLSMDHINQTRRMLGLPLQASQGSGRENWGMPYPLSGINGLATASVANTGVQAGAALQQYSSRNVASDSAPAKNDTPASYETCDFEQFKRNATNVNLIQNKPVQILAIPGKPANDYLIKGVDQDRYICVKLLKPGTHLDFSSEYIYGYILKGSAASKQWDKVFKKRNRYQSKGVTFKGIAGYLGSNKFSHPVGMVIQSIER